MRLPVTPTTTLWRGLRDRVRRRNAGGRVIVAVDGLDGAGKTVFADGLAEVFAETGDAVFRAGIDGFHRPRSERYLRGRNSPEGFYRDSFDYATFRRVLIDPFRDGAQTAGDHGLPAGGLRRRPRCSRRIAVGDRAARRGAGGRRHLPAPARAARTCGTGRSGSTCPST